jgi:hypothetical protein
MKKRVYRTPRPISRYERDEILAFWAAGLSQRRIGKVLDRNSVVIRRVCLGTDRVRRQEAINTSAQPAGDRLGDVGEHAGDSAVLASR